METRGDVLIRGLWDRQTDAIIDVKIGNADADTYRFEAMVMLLDRWDKVRKDKNSNQCHNRGKHFSPFVLYIVVMLGREFLVVLANFS